MQFGVKRLFVIAVVMTGCPVVGTDLAGKVSDELIMITKNNVN